jgi:hypothetical protein
MNDNHPVLNSMVSRLLELQAQYRIRPDGWTRYRLVRHEQLLAQWAPQRQLDRACVLRRLSHRVATLVELLKTLKPTLPVSGSP